ncbi:hypothetical protein LINGRAHAP2_LOCUS7760, partial [Linum grandiflorum]
PLSRIGPRVGHYHELGHDCPITNWSLTDTFSQTSTMFSRFFTIGRRS